MTKHHKEHETPDCGVSLLLVRELAERAGLVLTDAERAEFR